MKGLLLNNYYSAVGNIKLFSAVATAFGAVLIITGSPTAQELFIYITVTALSANGIAGMRKDAVSKWNQYELTLPIRRIDVVRCDYLSHMLWILGGVIAALLVTAAASLLHRDANLPLGFGGLCSTFSLGAGIAFLTGSFFYPLSYAIGAEKSETILLISILLSVCTAIVALNLMNRFSFSSPARVTMFTAAYLAAFGLSYLISLQLYRHKEY